MNKTYSKEVADYLNNKFGDDFTLAEPYPYWMKAPEQKNEEEKRRFEQDGAMTATAYKCWCDTENELRIDIICELGEDNYELKYE